MLYNSISLFNRTYSRNFFSIKFSFDSKKRDRNYFLNRLGLRERDISFPKKFELENKTKVDYWRRNPSDIKKMYGIHNLARLPIFSGDYINFGFWPNPNNATPDDNQRMKASELLYREIAEMASIRV